MTDGRNFRIIQTIASGGTAVLYKAIQVSLDRVVAVKRLHQHLTTDDNFTRRFILEAKAAASLDHENIVRVIDFGVVENCYQMVMEFVEGESLSDVLERWRPVDMEAALGIVHQICRGLEHAHSKGIVHRDIKPGNVMLTRAGAVKIADFGLAKLTQGSSSNTAADSILGTPLYMSPEQAFGESVDQRSDLFSLGTVLYELLTGRQPFASENYMGVIQNIINKEIPGVREINPTVSQAVEDIVAKALARNRDERFQSARAFREAIEEQLGPEGLNSALSLIPVLLERNPETRMIPRPAIEMSRNSGTRRKAASSAMHRRRSKTPLWIAAGVTVTAGIAAGYLFLGPGPRPRVTAGPPTAEPVQTAVMGDGWNLAAYAGLADTVLTVAPPVTGDTASTIPGTTSSPVADSAGAAPVAGSPGGPAPDGTPAEPAIPAPANPAPVVPQPEPSPTAEARPAAPARNEEPERFREGYLRISMDPPGQVYVNGGYRGFANPVLRLTLNAGTHTIECRSERHQSYRETLRIIAGETSQRTVALKKFRGIISLATIEGAEVYIDGTLIGITPIMRPIEVDAGTHKVTIKKADHHPWTSDVTVEANTTIPLRIMLSPRY